MPGKFKIVVSDLHLSAGRVDEGNPLEDFISDERFAAFLETLVAESERDGAEVELIVNGDAFEMLQVPAVEAFDPAAPYPPEAYHSSSEVDSARKMEIIIAGHRPFFDALGRFVRLGPPRRVVTFIKGNHDVNLHWGAVQERIRRAMGATSGRTSLLTFEERRVSREGIYVEHGNQYAELVDRLEDMEEPHDHDRPGQLALPLGSWFVMDVFNDVERERYWIDGVKPFTALVWYALAYDFAFAARSIARLLRALPGIVDEGLPEVMRGAEPDLLSQLEDPGQVAEMAARYEEDIVFRTRFNDEVARLLAPSPDLPTGEVAVMRGVSDPVAMGDQVRQRVKSSLYETAGRCAKDEKAQVIVFGHTHDASTEELPGGGAYFNSGTWTWRADFSGAGKETWRDLFERPERFAGDRLCSYVRIDYDDAGQPTGQLLAYELEKPPDPAPPPPVPTPVSPMPEISRWERVRLWLQSQWAWLTGHR